MPERTRIVKVECRQEAGLMRDVAALILRNLYPETLCDDDATLDQIKSYIRSMGADDSYCAMLDGSDRPVAAAHYSHQPDEGVTMVYELVVATDRRGQGYAAEMMQYIAEGALQVGDGVVSLHAQQPGFYAKLGFACTGEISCGEPVMVAAVEDVLAYAPANTPQ